MKRKFLVMAMSTVIAVSGYFVAGHASTERNLSAIELANVEALSDTEGGGITCNYPSTGFCWMVDMNTTIYNPDIKYYPCVFTGYQTDYCKNPFD